MDMLLFLNHIVNFILPAVATAAMVGGISPLVLKNNLSRRSKLVQWMIDSMVGVVVLGVGLWFFGNDGKMYSYFGMLVAMATSRWMGFQTDKH